ncbi:MAG: hypothetical protein ACTHQE_16120 [Thermomicrobiales bacterium]
MTRVYDRRQFMLRAAVAGSVATVAAASTTSFGRLVAAQDATPAATPAAPVSIAPDLQTITVTANDGVYNIATPSAGLLEGDTVIELVNATPNNIANVNFVMLPEDVSVGDFTSVLSTAFKGEGGTLPEWFATDAALFAGGAFAAPGYTTQTIVTLKAGRWVAFSSNPGSNQSAQVISVSAPEPAEDTGTPEASPVAEASPVVESRPSDNTITLAADGISLASEPTTSQAIWKVTNTSSEVMDVVLVKEVDTAIDPVAIAAALSSGGTVNGLVVAGSGALSPNATSYIGGTLEAGTYAVFSSLPAAGGGLQSAAGAATSITVA